MAQTQTIYEQVDSHLDGTDATRNRWVRNCALPLFSVATVGIPALIGGAVADGIYSHELVQALGRIAGGGLGALGTYFLVRKSIINNEINTSFTTYNALNTILGTNKPYVTYGPGIHICFPWEQRSKINTISLAENTVAFTFQVMCTDGLLTGKGSLRLRANIGKAIIYLGGYRAIADDISELVEAEAVKLFANKTISASLKKLGELNHHLEQMFGTNGPDKPKDVANSSGSDKPQDIADSTNLSAFEERFGVHVGDVTASTLLPSTELQRTISSVAEAGLIKKGTAAILGLSLKEVQERLQSGKMTYDTYNDARDRFLSVSGNLENMDISRTEFKLMGLGELDPELAKAIIAAAPLLTRSLQMVGGKKGGKK